MKLRIWSFFGAVKFSPVSLHIQLKVKCLISNIALTLPEFENRPIRII